MRAPEAFARLDARYRATPLPHAVEIPVLGIPTALRTNVTSVLDVVEEVFGPWSTLSLNAIDHSSAVTVRIIVHDEQDDAGDVAVTHAPVADDGLLVHAGATAGVSRPRHRDAVAYVSRDREANRDSFRCDVLEALTWALLTRFDRQPFHAAALAVDDAVLLLAGGTGSGKSTLAYTAARAGIDVLTDDIVFLQSTPGVRVWGMPAPVKLLPDAAAHFDELAGATPVHLHNGKTKIVAPLSRARIPRAYDRCTVCILGPRQTVPELRRITSAELLSALDLSSERGFDAFAESITPVMQALARRGGWMLHPSASPAESLPPLRVMLAGLSRAPVPA